MKKSAFTYLLALVFVACGGNKSEGTAGKSPASEPVQVVAETPWVLSTPNGSPVKECSVDTMEVSSPYIIYDKKSNQYYMVGDGGYMWQSRDMHVWQGPFDVLRQDTASWVGASPVVLSPEIHRHNGKYYYMATFKRNDCLVTDANGRQTALQSCVALVADDITGPYRTIDSENFLLDIGEIAGHPTFCTDDLGVGYMIYNHLAEQNGDGTVQIVRFTEDLGRRMGEAYVMFRASQNGWSSDRPGSRTSSPTMEAPFFFATEKGNVGILFTTNVAGKRTIGVAYSSTGHLNGPWEIAGKPLIGDGVGNAMIFRDYDGTQVMAVDKDTVIAGTAKKVLRLLKVDTQFDNLEIKGYYKF